MGPRGNSRRGKPVVRSLLRLALAGGVALCAILPLSSGQAQVTLSDLGGSVAVPEGTQLFLEADTVSYDREGARVTASGGVQIDYGDYQLVARNLVYDQATQRLVAAGDVELIEPTGNRIYADAVDITDDFANGFVEALRIETPENTRFAAQQAVRRDGATTTFERGVYTACEACAENPDRPPLWQVTARRIVWDQENEVVRYYGARFELFGTPIAYLPYFASPDSSAERQSGFLAPQFKSSDKTGFGVRVPYFWAISDDKDLTVGGTYYARQGFLADAEYRQAFESGYFTLQTAGIAQRDPDAFDDFRSDGVGFGPDIPPENRGMVGTTGRFALNQNWTVGWDALLQNDPNFSNVYGIPNFSDIYRTSEIYLTGLGERSFFDLRAQKFDVQTRNTFTEEVQPYVLPSLDYQRIEEGVLGGEVELNVNVTNLRRDETSLGDLLICQSAFIDNGICSGGDFGDRYRQDAFRYRGLEGDYTRATTEAIWRSDLVTESGLVLTPMLAARGDVFRADMSTPGFPDPATGTALGGLAVDETGARGMATAGLEARYPWLIETASTSHVIEPIAQLLVRPNEGRAGILPNEDAQSLVFNTTNLFSHDKFSGFDRIEGGTRANVGVKYAGVFGRGYTLDAVVGQSYHLAGDNPFAQRDLALVGYDSGLETDRSDYVSSLALTVPAGLTLAAQGRFDKDDLSMERADLSGSMDFGNLQTAVTYSQIAEQPTYGFAEDRQQLSVSGNLKLTEEISTFGALSYDVENSSIISRSFGVGYADECFTLLAEYRSTSDRYQLQSAESQVLFRLSLRTLVETEFGFGVGGDTETGTRF